MSGSVIVVGGGGHARVVIEAARSAGLEVLGFVDPDPCEQTARALRIARLGDDAALGQYPAVRLVLGVGAVGADPRRRGIVGRFGDSPWASVVHAASWVSPSAVVGEGAVVLAGAVVNAGARLGRFVVVNSGAVVEHDVTIGDFGQVAPGAVIGGGAALGDDVFVGLGASVRDHVDVGARCVVAMGAVVIATVPDGATVRGVPALDVPPRTPG